MHTKSEVFMLSDEVFDVMRHMFGPDLDELKRVIESDDSLPQWKYGRDGRASQSAIDTRQTDVGCNQEMANKINELYNELNQKDKDLKEARESVRRLQGSVREFRKRAEDAELNASRLKASYNGLAASYNKQVERNKGLRAELNNLNKTVEYLLAKISSEQDGTADEVSHKLTINDENGESSKTPDKEVDAIDVPLDAAEEIIMRLQGL